MPIITRQEVLDTIDRSISEIDAIINERSSLTNDIDNKYVIRMCEYNRDQIVKIREAVNSRIDDTAAHAALDDEESALVELIRSKSAEPESQHKLQKMLEDRHRRLDEQLNSKRKLNIDTVESYLTNAKFFDKTFQRRASRTPAKTTLASAETIAPTQTKTPAPAETIAQTPTKTRAPAETSPAPQAKPNYSFLMSLFSAPLSKVGSIVLCMPSLVLFGLVMSAVLPTPLGLTLAGISLVAGLGLFAINKTATEHLKNGPTMTHEASSAGTLR